MNYLLINFYDEQITVNMPDNLSKLKEVISDNFNFESQDVEELMITHKLGKNKILINDDNEYQKVINNMKMQKNIQTDFKMEIFIDVVYESRLFMESSELTKLSEFSKLNLTSLLMTESQINQSLIKKELLKKEIEDREKELNRLIEIEKAEEIEKIIKDKEMREKEMKEKEKNDIEKLRETINKTVKDIIYKNVETVKQDLINKTILETTSAVEVLTKKKMKKINYIESKPNSDNFIKCSNNNKKRFSLPTIHLWNTCDGCGKYPIVGNRYKCLVCPDFDFCESCEQELSEKHDHPFIKYRDTNNFNFFNYNSPIVSDTGSSSWNLSYVKGFINKLKNIFICRRNCRKRKLT